MSEGPDYERMLELIEKMKDFTPESDVPLVEKVADQLKDGRCDELDAIAMIDCLEHVLKEKNLFPKSDNKEEDEINELISRFIGVYDCPIITQSVKMRR